MSLLAAARTRLSSSGALATRRRKVLALALPIPVIAAAATGAAVSLSHRTHPVTVVVDGASRTVQTSGKTVGAVLHGAHVSVGSHDIVAPAVDAAVASGQTVVVRHGRPVQLTVGTTHRTVWVTSDNVGDALAQMGLADPTEYVSASRSRPIGLDGIALSVRIPQTVTVLHDGVAQKVVGTAPTVEGVLDQLHLQLHGLDSVSPGLTSYPTDGEVLRVTRQTDAQIVQNDDVPAPVTHVSDGSLYSGETRVTHAGHDGVIQTVFAIHTVNGRVTSKKLVSRTTTVAMDPEVVHVGTRARPVQTYSAPSSSGGLNWAALANCESGGNPGANTGNGYYGLYQFSESTWEGVGGSGLPSNASSSEQTYRAQVLYSRVGRSAWPVCGQYL